MQMQNLNGKVAVVTGASSGIGEAAARLPVAEGVTVVLTARRKHRIDNLAAELGDLAIAVEMDVADEAQVARLFKCAKVDALQAVDIAQALIYTFAQPPRVLVGEVVIRPIKQLD